MSMQRALLHIHFVMLLEELCHPKFLRIRQNRGLKFPHKIRSPVTRSRIEPLAICVIFRSLLPFLCFIVQKLKFKWIIIMVSMISVFHISYKCTKWLDTTFRICKFADMICAVLLQILCHICLLYNDVNSLLFFVTFYVFY